MTAYWGAGDGAWFSDAERARDLTQGWAAACEECRVSWGGGETQVLPSLIEAGRVVLGGSAIGLITPSENTLHGERLEVGDQILIAPASGIHANGLSLARKIAAGLPQGYQTPISDGRTYGEALLDPTPQYAPLIENLQNAGVPLHYAAHITGHGWRKIMRASRELTYRIVEMPRYRRCCAFCSKRPSFHWKKPTARSTWAPASRSICPVARSMRPSKSASNPASSCCTPARSKTVRSA